ncbi:MAG: zinc dependent phospholipase C family protein [Pirellulaceae bacterium]
MPGVVLHSVLATRVLAAWRASGEEPFDVEDETNRNAFLCGAVGPDVGYFPGGDRLLSDLAHYVRTGQLARELLRQAECDAQAAFAWGWATHILGDVLIHPLFNAAGGERVRGDREQPLSYDDDPVLHVRFEVGADAICGLARWPDEAVRLRSVFDVASAEYLQRCFASTYGENVTQTSTHFASHQASVRYSPFLWKLMKVVNRRLQRRAVSADSLAFYLGVYLPAKALTSTVGRARPEYGATHALAPPDWLAASIGDIVEEFPARFLQLASSGLEDLPDYNLDLGVVEDQPPEYPLTVATLAQLEPRRA